MRPWALAIVGGLALQSACSEGPRTVGPQPEVVDSASIRIITYPERGSSPANLRLDSVPSFRVGWDPTGRLFERIADMTVLPDGRIAVVDGGDTQEIVLLDPDGTVSGVLGGWGEGPGEFTGLSRVIAYGDGGIIAQDVLGPELTVFDGTGVEANYRLPFLDQKAMLGASGAAVVFGPPLMLVQGRRYPDPWRKVAVTLSVPPFSTEDTLTAVDWDQSIGFHGRDPWAASGIAAYARDRVVYGRGDRPELIWYALNGEPIQIVRWTEAPEPVSDSAYARFEEEFRADFGDRIPADLTRDMLDEMAAQHRGVTPYFDRLFVDPSGQVWVGGFLRPEERRAGSERTYHLLSRDGEARGTVTMPASLRVLDITTDLVVGYELGPYDEVAAVAYTIRK